MAPNVLIVVLNWNGRDDTLACLASLSRVDYPNYDIVAVDNGSSDDSVAVIRAVHPHAVLIETGENLGFAAGNNVGLRYALEQGADYVLLLNNDTIVDPGCVRQLVAVTEEDDHVGVVGPTVYYHSQPTVIWSAGGAIDRRRGRTWMVGLGEEDIGQFDTAPRPVDFVTGCALLVSRRALESVGLLDERFFMYYEETEWCVRIAKAGFGVRHVPTARIWHKIAPQAQAASPFVHYYMTRNRLLFLKITGGGLGAWMHTLVFEYLRTLISWSVRPKWRNKRAQRRAMLQALGDTWRGRWGKQRIAAYHSVEG
jgi:GT2 family glycosyltransferase